MWQDALWPGLLPRSQPFLSIARRKQLHAKDLTSPWARVAWVGTGLAHMGFGPGLEFLLSMCQLQAP